MCKSVFSIFVLFSICGVCYSKDARNINLRWHPTDSITDYQPKYLFDYSKYSYSLGNIIDERTEKEHIGINIENKNNPKYYLAKNSVPDFIRTSAINIMSQYNLKFSDSYDYLIIGKLRKFYVEEENTYIARIQIEFYLVDKNNDTINTCLANGDSHRWGHSYSEEMFLICISNSLFSCISDFMSQCSPLRKK